LTDRGKHQSIHTALIDDPTFQKLPPEAKLCFYTLKLMLGAAGIDVIRAHEAALTELTGLNINTVKRSLSDLVHAGFLVIQGNVLWLRNGLKFNPALNLDNENHHKSIVTHLHGLPRQEIDTEFAVAYELKTIIHGMGDVIPEAIGDTMDDAICDQEVRSKNKEPEPETDSTLSKESETEASFGECMKVIRVEAHLDPKDIEGKAKLKQSGDVLKKWLKAGMSPNEIIKAVRSTRKMVNAGEVSWIKPRQAFGLLACRSSSWIDGSSQPLYNAALERYDREENRTRTTDLNRIQININEEK